MCPRGPESPVGLVDHNFQLCLPFKFLVQSESKELDLGSQLHFMTREGLFFRPFISIFLVNGNITIFCGFIDN
jgi:hypothetical protein